MFFLAYIFHRNKDSKAVYYHDVSTTYTDMGTDIDLIKKHIDIIKKSVLCRICAQFSSPREFGWILNSTSHLFRTRLIKQHVFGEL